MSNYRLSVVIPSDDEPGIPQWTKALQTLQSVDGLEVIRVAKIEAPTRAERLNIGFHRAGGSMILFHHPRSFISRQGLLDLAAKADQKIWGGFTHQFDHSHPLLKFTSWYSNRVRARRGILYLDHCIFFHRSLWTQDLPAVDIFEDTILSLNLREHGAPVLLPYVSETSAIRFQKNGVWRQAWQNQILKIEHYLGRDHQKMNDRYEKNLNLNSAVIRSSGQAPQKSQRQ